MKLNFDFSPWISPVSGNIAFWQSFPDLPVNYTIEGDRENRPQPSSALIDIRLDIIDLRHAIDTLEQRPYPDLNATYILQQPDANLPNAQALNQLTNGLMKNNAGVIQIAIPNQDYLTPSLPSGQLWIGNGNNIATPSQIIALNNLPNLGTASITIPNPIDPTNPITISGGKIWQGTGSNRPEESSALLAAEADIALLNARFSLGEFIMGDALVQLTWPKAQFLVNLQDGVLKKTGKTLQHAVAGTDYVDINVPPNPTEDTIAIWTGNNKFLTTTQVTIINQNEIRNVSTLSCQQVVASAQVTANDSIFGLNNAGTRELKIYDFWNGPGRLTNSVNFKGPSQLNQSLTWIVPTQISSTGQALVDIGPNLLGERRLGFENMPPADATYIIKQPNANLPNAQVLNELGVGIAKIVANGAFAIAIAGEDYATAQQLQEIEQQCQQYAQRAQASAQRAAASATEAAASAGEATAAAGEATGAAGVATGSATAAGLSANGAAGAAVAAGLSALSASNSASNASSSASDASHSASNAGQSATNAANSATQAQTYLNTLLTTGLTLQGDVNGSGLLSSPIVTTFKPNPAFTGNQSMTIPVGNGSQRPVTLTAGMVRLNTGN